MPILDDLAQLHPAIPNERSLTFIGKFMLWALAPFASLLTLA
jgi:hypothetical protein